MALSFSYQQGSATLPAIQSISVFSTPTGASFAAAVSGTTGSWLTVGTGSSASLTTPLSVAVSVNVSGLVPATYTGSVTVSSGTSVGINVPVSLTVLPANPPSLSVSPALQNVSVLQGAAPVSGQVLISNVGGGSLAFGAQAASDRGWLTLSGSGTGSATPSVPAPLTFTVNPSGLSSGVYTGSIVVSDQNSSSQATSTVVLTVTNTAPYIQLSQTGLAITAVAGAIPATQSFALVNSGTGSLIWSAQPSTLTGGSWLQVSPASGTSVAAQSATDVSISANPAGLQPGQYYGSVNVVSPGAVDSPQTVAVVFNVVSASASPGVTVSAGGVILSGVAGSSASAGQAVNVFNPSSSAITYAATTFTANGTAWLSVNPSSGTLNPGTTSIQIAASLSTLSAGVQTGTVRLAASDGSTATIQVVALAIGSGSASGSALAGTRANLHPLAVTACPANKPSFLIPVFQQPLDRSLAAVAAPETLQVEIVDDCGNPVTAKGGGPVQITFSNGDAGVNLQDRGAGIWAATWTPVNAAPSVVLQIGASENGMTLNSSINLPSTVTVIVPAASAASAPLPTGIANAASAGQATPQVVAPGSYIAIYGAGLAGNGNPSATSLPLPTTLNGTQLFLGGLPMPLLYASAGQVNALVPQGIAPNAIYPLVVTRGGTVSVPVELAVTELQPGSYTVNTSGSGPGIVTNALTGS